MTITLKIAKDSTRDLSILGSLANRHGLVTGATGTGKTVTLQRMAQEFSKVGVPVFMADVKGDLSGIAKSGTLTPKLKEHLQKAGIETTTFASCPTIFWDIYEAKGHSLRSTISELGPLLLARILSLNEIQTGVLNIVFKVADENKLLLINLEDLRALLQYLSDHESDIRKKYGNVSSTSIGAIQRSLLNLENQGAAQFFGEPALSLTDIMRTDNSGHGYISLMNAERLMQFPLLYGTFLIWLLSELFETLPEVGDLEKPKLIFIFDEAHLIFKDAPKSLLERIEQVIRLIRSKGVGVYFVSQNTSDIPDVILGQLGNRIQHALRAFTTKDKKLVKGIAETMRNDTGMNLEHIICELGRGEALVSFLDEHGTPANTSRAYILSPESQIGPITDTERIELMNSSPVANTYSQRINRESAFEMLNQSTPKSTIEKSVSNEEHSSGFLSGIEKILNTRTGKTSRSQTLGEVAVKTAVRTLGRELSRGILGTILGNKR